MSSEILLKIWRGFISRTSLGQNFRVDLFSRKVEKFAKSRNLIHAKINPRKVVYCLVGSTRRTSFFPFFYGYILTKLHFDKWSFEDVILWLPVVLIFAGIEFTEFWANWKLLCFKEYVKIWPFYIFFFCIQINATWLFL